MSDAEKGWSDYWQKDSAEGEVFVNARGERHPALAGFWGEVFAETRPGSRIIDLASGAGSVFAHLPTGQGYELHAADISEVALDALVERFPGVATTVCPADDLPFENAAFDLVLTQFGIEYAGIDAFGEAARLVAPGGRFVGLCHVAGGYIDSDNQAQLREAGTVLEQDFIGCAKVLAEAAFSGDPVKLRSAQEAFAAAATPVGEGMRRHRKGIHTYLFQGFRQLYERRSQYDLADITGWLDAMRGELDVNLDRLARMCAAALSEDDVARIRQIFEDRGLEDVQCTPFMTPGNDLPVAWQMAARREQQR